MNKKWTLIFVLLFCIGGYFYYTTQESTGDHSTLYGNVDVRYVNLAFQHAGRLQTLFVDEGDKVKQGQLLATLDAKSYQDKMKIAKANLTLAKAQLSNILAGSRDQEIKAAYQDTQRLKATLSLAQSTLDRQEKLYKKGAVSRDILDNVKASYNETLAALLSAQQKYSLLKEGADKDDIAMAQAKVDIQQAYYDSAKTTLDETQLYAPLNATVESRVLEPGSMVGASTPILVLSIRSALYVRAYIDEIDLGKIALGDPVKIYTDSSDKAYQGHIGFIASTSEFTPKTVETPSLRTDLVYRIRIIIDGDGQGLNQGQPVTIKFNPSLNK